MPLGAILQARMSSTRLPGKVLADIAGASKLARVVGRTRAAVPDLMVATSVEAEDQAIVDACAELGVGVFRGDRDDVLDRFYRAAQARRFDPIVRITCDCPLLDPEVVRRVIDAFSAAQVDYASNT